MAARDFTTARAAATSALFLDPVHNRALVNLGAALVGSARWKTAAETFATAACREPCALPARRGLARLGGMIVGLAVLCPLLPLLPLLIAVPRVAAILAGVGKVGAAAVDSS